MTSCCLIKRTKVRNLACWGLRSSAKSILIACNKVCQSHEAYVWLAWSSSNCGGAWCCWKRKTIHSGACGKLTLHAESTIAGDSLFQALFSLKQVEGKNVKSRELLALFQGHFCFRTVNQKETRPELSCPSASAAPCYGLFAHEWALPCSKCPQNRCWKSTANAS